MYEFAFRARKPLSRHMQSATGDATASFTNKSGARATGEYNSLFPKVPVLSDGASPQGKRLRLQLPKKRAAKSSLSSAGEKVQNARCADTSGASEPTTWKNLSRGTFDAWSCARTESVLSADQLQQDAMSSALTISRRTVASARVIGQLDCKYILAVADCTIFAFDQHALDERVRFEALQARVLETGKVGAGKNPMYIISVPLDVPTELELDAFTASNLFAYIGEVESWGWRVKVVSEPALGSSSRHRFRIDAAPQIAGRLLSRVCEDLRGYLDKLAELFERTRPASAVVPPCVMDALASLACRSAVMFGDKLGLAQCEALIKRAVQCDFPFQCAHGRPSVVPLARLFLCPDAFGHSQSACVAPP
ncbi:DNA mismatch repair protein MLH3 [Porphyridium purpureum]|uniref:DNA mismatch repair protein MLH3 n=1 Tax=Porphyridium purpureum TaxID=35688 RepID=A0A5J4YS01_PORPP|nr:DNA mismatch repair protein MLH3 [Porphyridium purpureum]|eukprot:POR8340..scf229_5